jgi:hypothetical protein
VRPLHPTQSSDVCAASNCVPQAMEACMQQRAHKIWPVLLLLVRRVLTASQPLAVRHSHRPPQAAATPGPPLVTAVRQGSVMEATATSAGTAPGQVRTPWLWSSACYSQQMRAQRAVLGFMRVLLVVQRSRQQQEPNRWLAAEADRSAHLPVPKHTRHHCCCRRLEHLQRHGQVAQPQLPRPGWREPGPIPPGQQV